MGECVESFIMRVVIFALQLSFVYYELPTSPDSGIKLVMQDATGRRESGAVKTQLQAFSYLIYNM